MQYAKNEIALRLLSDVLRFYIQKDILIKDRERGRMMIKLDDILAIFIAALLAVSILFCSKVMTMPQLDGNTNTETVIVQAD